MATTEQFTLDWVTLSFPHLVSADRYGRYSAEFLVDPGSDADKAIQRHMLKVAEETWGEGAKAALNSARIANRLCYRNAEEVKDLEKYPNYNGKRVLRSSNKDRAPLLIDADMSPMMPPADKLYPGAIVRAGVSLWTHVYEGVKQVNCNLIAVQFMKDGERLGGFVPPTHDDLANLGFAPMPESESTAGSDDAPWDDDDLMG